MPSFFQFVHDSACRRSVCPFLHTPGHRWKMRGARHVEGKPIAAPAGPIARLAPWLPTKCPAACPQHTLFFERSAMSLRTRKLGPTQRPSRGSRDTGLFGKYARLLPGRPLLTNNWSAHRAKPRFQDATKGRSRARYHRPGPCRVRPLRSHSITSPHRAKILLELADHPPAICWRAGVFSCIPDGCA